jgi:hypothetical protein
VVRALVSLLLLAGPAAGLPAVPVPPEAVLDAGVTKAYADRAAVESQAALEKIEQDPSRSRKEKDDLKRKLSRLRLALYATPKTLDETVAWFESHNRGAQFVFAERNLQSDLQDGIRSGAIKADPSRAEKAIGQRGRSARWNRPDGNLEIAVEDHLIDPRNGSITRKTVILVTTLGE